MAKDDVGPRAWLAKALRRLAAAIERESTSANVIEWNERMAAYQATRSAHEYFMTGVYMPALMAFENELATMTGGVGQAAAAKIRTMLFAKHGIMSIEEEGDTLAAKCHCKLHRLIDAPSPSIKELAVKLALIHDKMVVDEPYASALAAVANDAAQLAARS